MDSRPVTIRDAAIADLPRIFEIYNREVEGGIATFDVEPKRADEDEDWLTSRAPFHPVLVALDDRSAVSGWASIGPWSPRGAYRRTGEVSVYVDLAARGRGLGGELLGALIERARGSDVVVLLARVAQPNAVSRALHAAHGFETFGVQRRCGEKLGRILDVELMDLHLD